MTGAAQLWYTQRVQEAGEEGVLILGSHYHSMMRTWDQTRPLLERSLEWLAHKGITEWVTFKEWVGGRVEP